VHLVRAFARVVADHPDAQLLLVGVGFRFRSLTQVVAEENLARSVHFLGERWDAPKLLRLADCFVLPSLYEGMSTALLEAMALSVPVVATAVSGTPEVIEDGKTGYLVAPADPVSLAHAISAVLDDPREAARMARGALSTVTRRHSFQRMVDAVEEILHQGW
jgi:glycosyltransferase involved in cell wall biosynthesis